MSPYTKVLLWIICSIWLVAGLIDYACHRRTHIELTAGVRESLLHLAQFAALGFSLVLALGVTVTPLSFALIALGAVLHSVLAFVDVAYTAPRRRISPLEQHVHGYLDVLPSVAVGLLALQHWDQLAAGSATLEWTLGSHPHAMTVIGIYILVVGVPIFEELARTVRYARLLGRASNTPTGSY